MKSIKRVMFWLSGVVVLVGLTGIAPVWAEDTVKIGVIAPFNTPPQTGPTARSSTCCRASWLPRDR